MNVLGIDPGRTTGWCVTDGSSTVVAGEVRLAGLSDTVLRWIVRNQITAIVIESVVPHGILNKDKVDQIIAHGVVFGISQMLDIPLYEVSPQAVKVISKSFTFTQDEQRRFRERPHAKDARYAVDAYLQRLSQGAVRP